MGDLDVSIFSISGQERGMSSGRNRRCPPAVVITHDSDSFSPQSINPAAGEGLLSYKGPGGLGASTLSLATEGRNGIYGQVPLSRTGSPRHSKIHPSDGSSLPKSGSSMAVFSPDGQLLGSDIPIEHLNQSTNRSSRHCCSGRAKRTALGFFLTVVMCGTWIGITHLLKWAYVIHLKPSASCNCTSEGGRSSYSTPSTSVLSIVENRSTDKDVSMLPAEKSQNLEPFKAPFFTTWFFTACNCLFFPVYLCSRICSKRKRTTATKSFLASMRLFQEKGLSALHFFIRSLFFCILWVATNYMLINALGKLDTTAVMALQASSASFVYLLSWVILHEQFVGIRIVAVILCNTGIALLAYMDGVSKTSTLGGVVLASAAAAGLAVHKVLFKKLIGSVTMGQLSLFLTLVGLLNVLLLWPIGLILYLVETEVIVWTQIPYVQVAGSAVLFIVANVMENFDIIHDYDTFLKLGIVSAVPVSAVLDVHLYNVKFEGMKLAGILLISIGFMLVLLPDNWPDYITRLIRWRCRRCPKSNKSTETTQPRSRLRAPSGNGK
ncbi:putative thiamine transporter SLC35F3 [Uloborus diversus]|uniref:putative thiamine transporter SLC35F3 n=1 Tax=Uloborus diversus TaxID=327109 RepID=UPI00240A2ACB|nr:putative thiamine transporter SLC35F3 [Uloborus diversus]